jgi:hypothetical protein
MPINDDFINSRRRFLQVGYSGLLGLSAAAVARGAGVTPAATPRAKSVIIVFCTGGISHHDTLDMKPAAPLEIRGEFRPVSTSVAGTQICEHLPRLAALAHRYALVRSLSHKDNNHLMSTHHVLTGHEQPGGFFDKVASRDDWPCYSSGLEFLRPRTDGVPSGVNLPTFLMSAPLTWPGQHAGFLGPKFDPWQITDDPNKPDFRVDALSYAKGLDARRLDQRQSLLRSLESTASLDEALVMMPGESGRTPKINKDGGRDHWGPCFTGRLPEPASQAAA